MITSTTTSTIENELHEQFTRLPFEHQQQVLEYVRALALQHSRGVTGESLLKFAGTITADDLALMASQINDGCEKVDANEW